MKKILLLLFCILISVPIILPYFHAGYFPTHDGEWAVVRLGDMFRTLRDSQIPARYSGNLNFGYGYPLFNFTYPLPYYLGVFLHILGFGFVNAIKFLFATSVILSALFMFLLSENLWKNKWAGIVSAILYVYFPYRMVDLYVRGSIGESLSFALFPLMLYLSIKLISKPSSFLIAGIAASVASLIMMHNIMTVLFLPVFLVFALINLIFKNKKAIKLFLISIILGFGLAAFFWIPAIFEKSNILLSKIPIADRSLYFVSFKQLIFPNWGYGTPTDPNGFSYQLGLAHLALIIIFVLYLLFMLIKNKKNLSDQSVKIAISLVVLILIYVFLLFKSSNLLWKNLPLLSEINYPWIALGISGFLLSLLAGFFWQRIIGGYLMILLGIIAIVLVLPYAKPQSYIDNSDDYYLTNEATTTSSNELMPLWVKEMPLRRAKSRIEVVRGNAKIKNMSFNSRRIAFSVDTLSQSLIRINTIYYPGWTATVDDVVVSISYSNKIGVMDVDISSGKHFVELKLEETPLRLFSNIISLASLITLLLLIVRKNKYAIF